MCAIVVMFFRITEVTFMDKAYKIASKIIRRFKSMQSLGVQFPRFDRHVLNLLVYADKAENGSSNIKSHIDFHHTFSKLHQSWLYTTILIT